MRVYFTKIENVAAKLFKLLSLSIYLTVSY